MPERLCEFCSSPISSMRGPRAKFCSSKCSERQANARLKKGKDPSVVVVHSCLSNEFDNFNAKKCTCRKMLGDENIQELFKQNAVRNLDPEHRRFDCWDKHDVFLIGKRVHTPRGATIERSHIERGVAQYRRLATQSPEKLKADAEDLERRIREDRLQQSEDEIHRWEVWAELQRRFFASLTREYSDSEWFAIEQVQRTLPGYVFGVGQDERTSSGVTRKGQCNDEEIEEQHEAPRKSCF